MHITNKEFISKILKHHHQKTKTTPPHTVKKKNKKVDNWTEKQAGNQPEINWKGNLRDHICIYGRERAVWVCGRMTSPTNKQGKQIETQWDSISPPAYWKKCKTSDKIRIDENVEQKELLTKWLSPQQFLTHSFFCKVFSYFPHGVPLADSFLFFLFFFLRFLEFLCELYT